MTRELLLLRHGKSDWSEPLPDFKRPITDRGKRGAQRIGVWLLGEGLEPDHVVSSPAERALVTAQKAIKAMGRSAAGIVRERRVHDASLSQLLAVLAEAPAAAQRVLLVGHNPGLEELLEYLSRQRTEIPADGKLLPTATLARLEMPDDWQRLEAGCASLLGITRGEELPEKFPFPGPGSDDLRDRPAYYYTQSSVVPYRRHEGELQVLIVSSSKNKHWVVPKGIQDPGASPQESAAKEAWEEAGVEGTVAERPLGSYQYEKWGSVCTCSVYPMEVTRVLPEDEWEERHRGREWVTPETASERLRQPELGPLVKALAAQLKA